MLFEICLGKFPIKESLFRNLKFTTIKFMIYYQMTLKCSKLLKIQNLKSFI